MNAKTRFNYPDSLRGLAALWVMGQHLWLDQHTQALFQSLPAIVNRIVFQFGYLGVAVFFTLSGFFMAHSLRRVDVTKQSLSALLLHRFLRLTPTYYVSIALAIFFTLIAALLQGQAYQFPNIIDLIKYGTYSQVFFPAHSISDVYWTLCLEIQFYIVFCLLLGLAQWCNRRWEWPHWQITLFSMAALVATLWPAKIVPAGFPHSALFFNAWYCCLLGALSYWSWQKSCDSRLFYGYVMILIGITIAAKSLFTGVAVLTAASLLMAGQQGQMGNWLNWRWLQFTGLISYTLYLIHEPFFKVLFPVSHGILGHSIMADLLAIGISFACCFALAKALQILIERPSIRFSQRLALKPKLN